MIDTARHTASGKQQEYTPVPAGTVVTGVTVNGTPGIDQFMVPVTLSTPNSAGLVIHEVRYGQTLWSIAIAYNTTIKQIRSMNDLPSDDIFSDQKLLIRRESIQTPTVSPTPRPPAIASETPKAVQTPHPTPTRTPVQLFPGSDPKKDNLPLIGVSIIATLCLAAIGVLANKKRS